MSNTCCILSRIASGRAAREKTGGPHRPWLHSVPLPYLMPVAVHAGWTSVPLDDGARSGSAPVVYHPDGEGYPQAFLASSSR
jgi:hypothetical protein